MDIDTMTLDGLITDYQQFLEDNLTGKEVTKIADKIQKSPRTIYNYLDTEATPCKAVDFLTMKAIVEHGVEILSSRGVTKI